MTANDSDLVIKVEDMAARGYCLAGQKRFCEANGIDFRDYVRNGIPASRLLATGDAMAIEAVVNRIQEASTGG